MDADEMIDRYVNEVGNHLPRKMRADIEMELRSLLFDALEKQSGDEPTQKETAVFLQDFGHPEEIAAQYRPDEVLIGSQLFPTYKLVISIILILIGVLHLFGLGFLILQGNPDNVVETILNSVGNFARSAALNVGIVTLIFAVIERVAGESLAIPSTSSKQFDPYNLPPVKDPDRINRGELLVGIFFTLLFLSWLNFFPDWFGGANLVDGERGIFFLVAPEFMQFIPWISAAWLMDVGLKTAVVIQGRWNRMTRWLELGVQGFSLYVTYQIYLSEAISTVPFFTSMIKWILAVVMVITVLDMLGKLYRLLLGRPFSRQDIFTSKLA